MKEFYEKYKVIIGVITAIIFLIGIGYGLREGMNSWINLAIDVKLDKQRFEEFITEQRLKQEKKDFRDSVKQATDRYRDSLENYYSKANSRVTTANTSPAITNNK